MRSICLCLFFSLFFIGCTASESSSHRRGKLSDAVDAASDDRSGDRTVKAEFQSPEVNNDLTVSGEAPDTSMITAASHSNDTSGTTLSQFSMKHQSKQQYLDSVYQLKRQEYQQSQDSDAEKERNFLLGISGSTGILSSNEFYGMSTVGVNVSGKLEQGLYGELGADMTFAPLRRTSLLSHSIDNGIILLELNLQLRFPTTPEYTFFGNYLLLGGGVNIMLWSYKNPIKAPVFASDGTRKGYDMIGSDQLKGIDLFTGIGFDLTQTLPFHLIVEIKPGVIIWTGPTVEGFDNDIFANFTYLQFRAKLNF